MKQVAEIVQEAYYRYGMGSGWEDGRDGKCAKKALAELDNMAARRIVDDPVAAVARAIDAYLRDPAQSKSQYSITRFWSAWGYYTNGPGGPRRPRQLNPGPPRGPDGKFLF